jgi:hypothetical protein
MQFVYILLTLHSECMDWQQFQCSVVLICWSYTATIVHHALRWKPNQTGVCVQNCGFLPSTYTGRQRCAISHNHPHIHYTYRRISLRSDGMTILLCRSNSRIPEDNCRDSWESPRIPRVFLDEYSNQCFEECLKFKMLECYMRFEVLTVVKMSMVFWVVTPCGLVGRYQCFGGTYCLHLQGWISVYWTLW